MLRPATNLFSFFLQFVRLHRHWGPRTEATYRTPVSQPPQTSLTTLITKSRTAVCTTAAVGGAQRLKQTLHMIIFKWTLAQSTTCVQWLHRGIQVVMSGPKHSSWNSLWMAANGACTSRWAQSKSWWSLYKLQLLKLADVMKLKSPFVVLLLGPEKGRV